MNDPRSRPLDLDLEPERYELREESGWSFAWNRREFLGTLGGGLVVLCLLREAPAQESGRGRRGGQGAVPRTISAWLHIAEDGKVTVSTGKAEVGQNARTSLTQSVADELRVAPTSVEMVMSDTDRVPFDMGTFGSRTTPTMVPQLRRAAAAARRRLIVLAARQLGVDEGSLEARDGQVIHPASNRSVSFGALTRGQRLVETIDDREPITPAEQWTVAGQSLPKVQGRDIVTGRHRYASDVTRPGLQHGKVLRPPSYGASLSTVDLSKAKAIPGVVAVRDGDFVGVVAPDASTANRALAAIEAEWTPPREPPISDRELFDSFRAHRKTARDRAGGRGARQEGSIESGLRSADVKVEASYEIAYIAHAPLEPRAAVAEWEGNRLTVWTGTQRPFGVRSELAQAFGLPEDHVRVIVPDTGSGYGGKHTGEAAIEAARLAKAAGRPVKRVWSREEEFTWAYFRPAGLIEAVGGARKDGSLVAWEFHNVNSGGSGLGTPYEVPNRLEAFHPAPSPLRQGSYRALASTANHFAREALMDELADALGMDRLEFRRKNLRDERLRAVLDASAERFGWGKPRPAPGRGFGIACGTEKGGFVATCVEVAADLERGEVKVLRAVTAFECGAVINPDHLKNQVEGALTMGLGGALFEAIRFEQGQIRNGRFARYRVPRFADTPTIDVVLLDRKDRPSAGAGESPIVAIAPAIAGAIHDAVGVRLRALPLVPNGLRA